jgi:uronate dehydrogenase
MRKKIVITGAAGAVIGRVLPMLREMYELVLLDVYDMDSTGHKIEDIQRVDLVNPNRDDYRGYFKDADVVIHTAYMFSQRMNAQDSSWLSPTKAGDSQFKLASSDIQMAYNMYKTAQEEGVKRVVVFSSNHATDYYEELIKQGVLETVTEDMPPYSDNFYGWSKICEETLGHLFASGAGGKALEVIMLRIGAPRTDLIENCTSDNYYPVRRHFGSYLSINDEIQLLRLCIEKDKVCDENGFPFLLVYATSDNYNRIWSLRNARRLLGFKPEDSSYNDFSERAKQLFVENIDKEKLRKVK